MPCSVREAMEAGLEVKDMGGHLVPLKMEVADPHFDMFAKVRDGHAERA
eukprot:COSAG01_NODE_9461_length_2441_cov_1.419300_3_plen_49_part_00